MTRRTLLGGVLAIPAFAAGPTPEISALDLSLADEAPTPNELFFVREHNPAPRIGAAAWKLAINGAASSPFEIAREQLLSFPRVKLPATLECAENPPGGGLVSHAIWEGIPAAALIEQASPPALVKFVRFESYDGYSRTLPIEKVRDASVLIASRMNGELLPATHGGPARLIVAGWYGMDSVKWLSKVTPLESLPTEPNDYLRQTRSLLTGVQAGDPVSALRVKSAFTRPVDGAVLRGRNFILRGIAWSESPIAKAEVSTDAGVTWTAARLSKAEAYSWTHWTADWAIPAAGKHTLLVRATDRRGATQPIEREANRADPYEQNSCQRIEVLVR